MLHGMTDISATGNRVALASPFPALRRHYLSLTHPGGRHRRGDARSSSHVAQRSGPRASSSFPAADMGNLLVWLVALWSWTAAESRVLLQQSTFYYSDYVYGRVHRPATFLPNPQFCPQTGGTVCSESVPYYPRKTILQAAKHFNRTDLFVDEREGDEEPDRSQIVPDRQNGYVVYQTMHYPNYFHARIKRNTREVESACASRTSFLSPRTALNDKSQWKFIVNIQNTQYQQVIRIELCAQESSACSSQIQVGPGYSASCKQKFIKKKLLALNPDGQGLTTENFFVPSCCVCHVSRDSAK